MSATSTFDDGETYQIETKISAGNIKDPVTGDSHEITSKDGERGGVLEVSRPDSAKLLVEQNTRMQFVNGGPSESAVQDAQDERSASRRVN